MKTLLPTIATLALLWWLLRNGRLILLRLTGALEGQRDVNGKLRDDLAEQTAEVETIAKDRDQWKAYGEAMKRLADDATIALQDLVK